ncbi:MAG: transcriptional repressor [Planctomycetaceae bacterium]
MTAPREWNTERARKAIRDAGLRSTGPRVAVLLELGRADRPLTHGEVAERLAPRGFDKVTVFRNLTDLTEAGLLARTELGDHVWRFELRGPDDPDRGTHPHFVCVDCGSVTCMSDVAFDAATRKRAARIGEVTEVLLKGRCTNCG